MTSENPEGPEKILEILQKTKELTEKIQNKLTSELQEKPGPNLTTPTTDNSNQKPQSRQI